jgi:hypothetical protein
MGEVTSTISLPREIRSFEEFARVDVATGDIDPMYYAIYRMRSSMGEEWTKRFALAFLIYYHTGTAMDAANSDRERFWDYIRGVFLTAPRAAERRHCRGAQGRATIDALQKFSPDPSMFFDTINAGSYKQVRKICEKHLYAFGPYFQLKVVDLLDRCFGMKTDYIGLEYNLPTLPAQAVGLLYPDDPVYVGFMKAVNRIEKLELPAPPMFDRPVGRGEVETILCDWKRAFYSRHIVGDDIVEKRHDFGNTDMGILCASFIPEDFPLTMFRCVK